MEYRGLGFDPVPGSPDAVDEAARRFSGAAELAGAAATGMEHAAADADWAGAAAEAYRAGVHGPSAGLAAGGDTARAAAEVLDGWAGVLRANRHRAGQLDGRATELRRAIVAVAEDVANAATALQVAIGSAARTAQGEYDAAVTQHGRLQTELERVLDQGRALQREHVAAAQRVAARLRALARGATAAGRTGPFGPARGADPAGPFDAAGAADPAGPFYRAGPFDAADTANAAYAVDASDPSGRAAVQVLARTVGSLSVRVGELGATLLGRPGVPAAKPPPGAVGAFVSALAGPAGRR